MEAAQFLIAQAGEGIRQSRDGWADDDIAFTTPWAFDLTQIGIPVMLMHGEQDQMVPFSHAKWLAGRIPNVHTRFLPDDGHLTIALQRVPEVHAWLLSKMN